ncbi:MAG TPA: hypothetical protein VGE72_25190, partial [Azospirillum sp.]
VAILGLRLVSAEFTASMVVGPTARTGVAAMGPRVPAAGPEVAAGIAEQGAGDETLSDFARFLELLGSAPVAARLADDPALLRRLFPERWDAAAGEWRAPVGLAAGAKRLLLALAGREDWVEPDVVETARRLREHVVVATVGTGPMRRIAVRHAERGFALDLLGRLVAATDAHLRAEAARRSAAQIAYVGAQIARVTKAEHRRILTELLAEQERVAMLIEVDLPFAADPIEPPTAARLPDWPDPRMVLPLGLVIGTALGVLLVNLRACGLRAGGLGAWGRG